MATSRFIDINGLKLHYIDYGREGRPYLILLHGLNGNAHAFDLVAPSLAASHHVIALDLRGHGDSQWGPPDGYTPPNYLGDIGAFLKRLSIEKAGFIGSSMGGAMAMIFATLAPNIVDRLVLNDIGGEIVIEAPDPAQPALTDRRFRTIADATRFYRESFHPIALLPELVAEKLTADSVKTGEDGLLVWKTDPAVNSGAATGAASGGRVVQMWSFYQKVNAPVLIVRGAESTALTRDGKQDALEPAGNPRRRSAGRGPHAMAERTDRITGAARFPGLDCYRDLRSARCSSLASFTTTDSRTFEPRAHLELGCESVNTRIRPCPGSQT